MSPYFEQIGWCSRADTVKTGVDIQKNEILKEREKRAFGGELWRSLKGIERKPMIDCLLIII